MTTDDDTLYVLNFPEDRPQRFGHKHGGEMVEFTSGESVVVEFPTAATTRRRETEFTCPGCGNRIKTSEPMP